MTIFVEQLQHAIDRLPDPNKYQYSEYRSVILEPIAIHTCDGTIPLKGTAKEISFKKVWSTEGKYKWTIDI